jgi:hypothetical protein
MDADFEPFLEGPDFLNPNSPLILFLNSTLTIVCLNYCGQIQLQPYFLMLGC